MKINFKSDDDVPLNKTIELHSIIVIVIAVLLKDRKYYPQIFLDECLYKLQMLEYDRIGVWEGTDVKKN